MIIATYGGARYGGARKPPKRRATRERPGNERQDHGELNALYRRLWFWNISTGPRWRAFHTNAEFWQFPKNTQFQLLREAHRQMPEVETRADKDMLRSTTKVPHEPRSGYVYLVQSGQHFKIGITGNIKQRVISLETVVPEGVKLLAHCHTINHVALEKQLHDRYAKKRLNGEWFELAPEDVVELVTLLSRRNNE
jgi:hypothetical protein